MHNILQEGVTIRMRIIANTILGDEYLYIFPMRTRIEMLVWHNEMLVWQSSEEKLQMKRSVGGGELKSLREVFEETRLPVTYYIFMSKNKWIKVAWRRETDKALLTMKEVETKLESEGQCMRLEEETPYSDWKQT